MIRPAPFLAMIALIVGVLAGATVLALYASAGPDPGTVRLQDLVTRLGHPDPDIAAAAERDLLAAWPASEPFLSRAAESPSPLLAQRAGRLLRALRRAPPGIE